MKIEGCKLVSHGLNCVQNFYGVARIVLTKRRFTRVVAALYKHRFGRNKGIHRAHSI